MSVNRLRNRKSPFIVRDWIMDSGAFSELAEHGRYRHGPEEYIEQIERWRFCGNLRAAVTQDWMCEPWIVEKTGLSVEEHQALTIERYVKIRGGARCYVMPVLQGYALADYLRHIERYGSLLRHGMWVGVGSVCKRNVDVAAIEDILMAIKRKRPDLRLHGFGLKITALASATVRDCLESADSMAWSYSARKQGRNPNDWREAKCFEERVARQPQQLSLWS